MATTTRAVYDGDFDSAYVVKVSTTEEGGPARSSLNGTINMTIQANRVRVPTRSICLLRTAIVPMNKNDSELRFST